MINPKYKNVFMSPGEQTRAKTEDDGPSPLPKDSDQPTKTKKSLITAVKKLLGKLGAEEVEGNNLVEVIDNGADALVEQSSSDSEPFVVTFSGLTSKGDTTCNKTYNELSQVELKNMIVIWENVILNPYKVEGVIGGVGFDHNHYYVKAEVNDHGDVNISRVEMAVQV